MNRRGTEPYARWCERPEGQPSCLLDSFHFTNVSGSMINPVANVHLRPGVFERAY